MPSPAFIETSLISHLVCHFLERFPRKLRRPRRKQKKNLSPTTFLLFFGERRGFLFENRQTSRYYKPFRTFCFWEKLVTRAESYTKFQNFTQLGKPVRQPNGFKVVTDCSGETGRTETTSIFVEVTRLYQRLQALCMSDSKLYLLDPTIKL
jgi:hypothetical protein